MISLKFAVYNDVKLGCPTLLIDNFLLRPKSANTDCCIGNFYLGNLAYADDLTLLAPTADAMRTMLANCAEFAKDFYCRVI
jgi:hypothetical protein